MRSRFKITAIPLTALAFILSGCSGGGSASGTSPVTAVSKMVSGVAATGAPVAGAVTLKDSSPVPIELLTSTAGDGSFAFNTEGLIAPFIIRTRAGAMTIYSMATDNGITNITPLTTIVLSSAVSGADLDNLYTNPGLGDLKSVAARIPDAVAALQSVLDPLLKQYGISGNILNTPFNANHTGVDALLDAITVSITAGTVTITDKSNSAAVIFSAPCANIKAGTLVVANIPAATTVPASTPVLTPTPVSTNNPSQSPALGGAALYAANCEGCHGPLATSSKTGITSTRLSDAISSDLGGMGSLSSLTSAEQQAIVTALTPATTAPTPTTVADGVSLYGSSCSGCHGALASSGKAGATVSRIQTAINNNTGGMGYLISLNLSQITAIASALTTVTPTSTPAPTAVCGSCHSIPPANGQHSRHLGKGVACATCHGTGYSTTSFNSSTHNNGIKNIASTIGWNSTSRSCSNSCHGTEPW